MNKKYLLLIGLLLVAVFSNAQINTEPDIGELLNCNAITVEVAMHSNTAVVNQIGNRNEFVSIQQQESVFSNVLISEQSGNENSGYIKQVGSLNASILLQKGSLNEANIWSVGKNTQNSVFQKGTGNTVNSYIENYLSPLKSATSFQFGSDNRIDIALLEGSAGSNPASVSVTQNGNANSAELVLDHYAAPFLKVEQTGGAAISITHSAFSFPMK